MPEPPFMQRYARRVLRDASVARTRSLLRRLAGPLFRKYLGVVPSVFTARGELRAYRLLLPRAEARERLRDRAVFTLDTATEVLAGFRFGRAPNDYAYFRSTADLAWIEAARLGERRPGTCFPLAWTPPGWEMLFAVVPDEMPPAAACGGLRLVTREHLIRDLIGLYGPRVELLASIEAKLQPVRPSPGTG
jgi:hypothetical protein